MNKELLTTGRHSVMYEGITPVERMGNYWVKREDIAYWSSLDYPSGSKVRQYMSMMPPACDGECENGKCPNTSPCLVGCSANSAMAIYVAAAAKQSGRTGIIYTAARKVRTDGIKYAEDMGAEIVEVKPGYLSLIRARAKARAIELGSVVKWSPQAAIEDTIRQCDNIPEGVKRIVVPTGSGLTAAGVLSGLSHRTDLTIVVVATSQMSQPELIIKKAHFADKKRFDLTRTIWPSLLFIPPTTEYDQHEIEALPDGTPLDPWYSAKAFKYLQEGDLFWPPGLRPVRAMTKGCQKTFDYWRGPPAAETERA